MKSIITLLLITVISVGSCKTPRQQHYTTDKGCEMDMQLTPSDNFRSSVTGELVDIKNEEPLPAATIKLTDEKGKIAGAYTNEQGVFNIQNLQPGKYQLLIEAIGYHKMSRKLTIRKPTIYKLRVRLKTYIVILDK